MLMLVSMGPPRNRNRLPSVIFFLVITLAPWLVMIWLLWPPR
jgi:hypothetical protein